MVGLGHLARLLAQPSREIHVVDLVAAANGQSGRHPMGDSGEHLDARARTAYAARLRAAREDLEEAHAANDVGRSERLEAEIACLTSELSRGYGLGRHGRRAGSAPERARIAVTRAIRYAIDRVGQHHPGLGEHLRLAVHTGVFCSYTPSSRDRVDWSL